MKNTISKEQLTNYINDRIKDFQDTIKLKCFYVLGLDARELIGTVRTAFILDVFTEIEKDNYLDRIYPFLHIAENNEHRGF